MQFKVGCYYKYMDIDGFHGAYFKVRKIINKQRYNISSMIRVDYMTTGEKEGFVYHNRVFSTYITVCSEAQPISILEGLIHMGE